MHSRVSSQTRASRVPLRRNFSSAVVGTVVYAICQWGMITVLAKLGTPEMVGQFALALALTAPIILFANLQLRSVQATDARREYAFSDYLILRIITTIIAIAIASVVVTLGGYGGETAWIVMIVAAAKGIDAVSDAFYGLFQQHEHMDLVSKSLVLNGGLSLFFLVGAMATTDKLLWGVVGFALGSLVPLFFFVIPKGIELLRHESPNFRGVTLHLDRESLLTLGRTAIPLGLASMLVSLNTNIPRYFIDGTLGQRELGIFAALAYTIVAVSTVFSALGQAATPRLAIYHAEGNFDEFRSLLGKLMLLGLASGALGLALVRLAGNELVTLLYSTEYAEHIDVLYTLTASAGVSFVGSFASNGLMAMRLFTLQLPLSFLVLVTSLLASMLLIPRFGLLGAAISVGAATLVQSTLSSAVVFHMTKRRV